MATKEHPNGYWTYETCYEEAKKYETTKEFRKNSSSAYGIACKKNWINDYYWLRKKVIKPKGYWVYETCYEEAKKYKTRNDFLNGNQKAYTVALKNKWIDDYVWFLSSQSAKKWYRETCYEEAKKYTSKSDFQKNCSSAYHAAWKNGWLEDYTWFIDTRIKWTYERCYEEAKKYNTKSDFKFGNNSAYSSARTNGWLDDYTWFEKKKDIWNRESCYNEAIKYKTKLDFQKGNCSAYAISCRNGWINDYTWFIDPMVKWTYETCYEEAKKYKSRWDFGKNCPGAYNASRKNGWIDDYKWFEYVCMPKTYRFNLLKEFIDEYELRAFLENNDENILYIILRNVEPKYEPLVDEVEKIIRNSNGNDPMKALIDKYSKDETTEDVNKDNETSNETNEEIHGLNDVDLDDDKAVKEALKQEEEKKEVSIDDVVKNTEKELEVINKIEHLLTPEDREYIMDKFLNDKLREYMAKKDAQK